MQLTISKNMEELSWQVTEWIVGYVNEVMLNGDNFTISLSGGSTPKKLYQLLASKEFRNKINWEKVHVFWGDERCVPFSDERNNAKMAFDVLLNHVPVPRSQIHVMRTDIDAEASADDYEASLKNYFPEAWKHFSQLNHGMFTNSQPDRPGRAPLENPDGHSAPSTTFDLVLLGLGDNSHTLSLFPGEQVIHEKRSWVKAVFVKEVNMQRITLTAPVVNLAKRIAFLVSGQDKADAVSHVLLNDYVPDLYPAQVIKPTDGELYWFMDEAAAARINK